MICFHEGLVFLLLLIATTVLTEKLRDKCGVFELPTLPKSPPKAPVTGTEGNVGLHTLRRRRKSKFTSSSTGVQTIILLVAHLEEVPQFLLRKKGCTESEQLELPKSCFQSFCSWAARSCSKDMPTCRGSEEHSWLPWPAPTATSDSSYVVETQHGSELNSKGYNLKNYVLQHLLDT